jgi:hypothetical protein
MPSNVSDHGDYSDASCSDNDYESDFNEQSERINHLIIEKYALDEADELCVICYIVYNSITYICSIF